MKQKILKDELLYFNTPLVNTFYTSSAMNLVGRAFFLTAQELENVIYHRCYIVLDLCNEIYNRYELLDSIDYYRINHENPDFLYAATGAEALINMLDKDDFEAQLWNIETIDNDEELTEDEKIEKEKTIILLKDFIHTCCNIDDIILKAIPYVDYSKIENKETAKYLEYQYNRLEYYLNRINKLYELDAPLTFIDSQIDHAQGRLDIILLILFSFGYGNIDIETRRIYEEINDLDENEIEEFEVFPPPIRHGFDDIDSLVEYLIEESEKPITTADVRRPILNYIRKKIPPDKK